MTTTSMKERLARFHAGRFYDSDVQMNNGPERRQEYIDFRWPVFLKGVDEDLAELEQPSEADEHVSRLAKGPEMLQDLDPEEILQIRRWWIEHVRNDGGD